MPTGQQGAAEEQGELCHEEVGKSTMVWCSQCRGAGAGAPNTETHEPHGLRANGHLGPQWDCACVDGFVTQDGNKPQASVT